ncbi:MAG TPA: class I SAM-dependent methyltransferase, partial [Pseudonocardiaceae bacterium]|nr:class I SAM-dependent methyltransferase [Pseudonocardiaceae bacterium]
MVTRKGSLEVPENVTFVPTDFNTQILAETMTASGYRPNLPTVFLWEGTTNYLTEPAVDATLRWCAGHAAADSLLLLTYHGRTRVLPSRIGTHRRDTLAANSPATASVRRATPSPRRPLSIEFDPNS